MSEEMKNEVFEEAAETVETVEEVTEEENEDVGNIKISVEVVSTIASIATSEIKGVAGMYSSFANGIVNKLGAKKNLTKGVRVEMMENLAAIDVYIVVDYGVRIPELAWEIQESVKNNVETMTGLEVDKVNIHIEGVSFEKTEEKDASVKVVAEIEE